MSEPRFVHLWVHSDYSMIDGLAKTAPLVKKAAALGMPALAITDFTNLCGLVKFYGTGHGAGIKPIVGADFHVQCDLLGDEFTELTVLALPGVFSAAELDLGTQMLLAAVPPMKGELLDFGPALYLADRDGIVRWCNVAFRRMRHWQTKSEPRIAAIVHHYYANRR